MAARKFTPEEIALIHRTFMAEASKDDLALFIATCERTGLDPFARQIMASSRNVRRGDNWVTVWTWLVTIDGLRKIAVDSGDYEGQEGPWWCGKDGEWKEVWSRSEPCFAAKVLVHRKGFRTGLSGIAKYESYVQKKKDGSPNQVWSTLGDHMTAKCAEALALRRAYPNEMAGLYTSDEMAQAGFEPAPATEVKPIHPAPDAPPSHSQEWDIENLSEFEALLDRAYKAFKIASTVEAYNEFAAKWKAAKQVNPPKETLEKLEDVVKKLEDAAAAKKQPKEPEAA